MARLAGKFLINLGGAVLGVAVALITVPMYVHQIGEARYGILSLVWMLMGYLGFLDFGLSRATANALAKMADAPAEERSTVFSTALIINVMLGSIGGLILCFGGKYALLSTRDLEPYLREEIISMMPYLLPLLPMALISGVGIGALESKERFAAANVLQIGTNILSQIGPLLAALYIAPTLSVVVPAIMLVRIATTITNLLYVTRSENLRLRLRFQPERLKKLLSYGVWVTLTNLVSPLMTSLDQFVISTTLGASQVTRYAVPMTMALRLQMLSGAFSRTAFPRFSRLEAAEAKQLAGHGLVALAYLSALVYGPMLVMVQPFFVVWMGQDFAVHAVTVARLLLFGAWMNGLASVPYAYLQGQGKPDKVAKLHISEVLPYLLALWFFTGQLGVAGAAVAWALRTTIDALMLTWMARLPLKVVCSVIPAIVLLGAGCFVGICCSDFSFLLSFVPASALGLVIVAAGLVMEPRLRALLKATIMKIRKPEIAA